MKLIILLAFVGATLTSAEYSLEEILYLADEVESDLALLNKNLSSSITLGHVIDERTVHFTDFIVPTIVNHNANQDERIAFYDREIKEIEHKVDDLTVFTTRATTRANAHHDKIAALQADFDALPNFSPNISALRDEIDDLKTAFFASLYEALEHVHDKHDPIHEELDYLKKFVKSRNCEFGSGTFSPYEEIYVAFKTNFTKIPKVSLSITGFKSHLDIPSYEEYDGISMLKTFDADSVTLTGFKTKVEDSSQGMVIVKTVDCSWMACENLSENFYHED